MELVCGWSCRRKNQEDLDGWKKDAGLIGRGAGLDDAVWTYSSIGNRIIANGVKVQYSTTVLVLEYMALRPEFASEFASAKI